MANITGQPQLDPYVVIEGGIVANDPATPVFQLDVFEDEVVDSDTFEEIGRMRDRAAALIAEKGQQLREENRLSDGQRAALQRIVDDCDRWLSSNAQLDPTSPRP